MTKLEKVIKGLECCALEKCPGKECPYVPSACEDDCVTVLCADALELLKEREPTVDTVPVKHGRWIKMTGMMPPEYHGHYECSECQWHMKGLRNSWTRKEELSYCPNCGAKMDEERWGKMKLYTSYWGQVRNFPNNLVVLSTVAWPPKWYKIGDVDKNGVISLNCPPLIPGEACEGLCEGKCNPKHSKDCAFLKAYRKQLDKIDFNDFMDKLLDLRARLLDDFPDQDDFDFAFVFYEKYDNPCSERWAVQDWLRAHNIEIEEWKKC